MTGPCTALVPNSYDGVPFGEPIPCGRPEDHWRHDHGRDHALIPEDHQPILACHPYQAPAIRCCDRPREHGIHRPADQCLMCATGRAPSNPHHPYKEEPMPKPVTVHTGRIVSILAEVDPTDGSGVTEVTIRLDGRPDALELGGPAVFAESIPDLMLDLSKAEQAVIDAAIAFSTAERESNARTEVRRCIKAQHAAVDALRETAKKGGR